MIIGNTHDMRNLTNFLQLANKYCPNTLVIKALFMVKAHVQHL